MTLTFPSLIFSINTFTVDKGCAIKIGRRAILEKNSEIICKGQIIIGSSFSLNKYSRIVSHELITIGDNVIIAQFVSILDHDHKYKRIDNQLRFEGYKTQPITIGNNVWIGDKVTICKGVNIGNNVIIAANSVVTHNIEDNCVAAGSPCKMIKSI